MEREKPKIGRPPKEIDEDQLYRLAAIHCTYEEMAAVMKCCTDTLKNRFSDLIERGRNEGKASLRRMQYQKAKEGNVVMMIWLGKQILGQSEKVENVNVNHSFVVRDE